MKICKSNKRISREFLANPFSNLSYYKRLIQVGSVDLTEDLGNGYCRIKIIDETKLVK